MSANTTHLKRAIDAVDQVKAALERGEGDTPLTLAKVAAMFRAMRYLVNPNSSPPPEETQTPLPSRKRKTHRLPAKKKVDPEPKPS